MKSLLIGLLMIIAAIVATIFLLVQDVRTEYQYEREVASYWSLADKSSTIPAKSEYVDKFVVALQQAGLNGTHDAILFPTGNNSFDANFLALQTLQNRLREIQRMNVTSFEYQTAISQITAQEQGEAEKMLNVFEGCWTIQHYTYLYDWVQGLEWLLIIICIIIGGFLIYTGVDS